MPLAGLAFLAALVFTQADTSNLTQATGETVESAQGLVEKNAYPLPDITVTATRTDKPLLQTPAQVHLISGKDMTERRLSRTVPEALMETPGVMVQKTANGQGSPYMRGFTGFRTLFLIDGIRLNNSVFREGPNQYWNTVDPLSLSRMEVVMGSGSVLYGSDAVGGTVNAITRSRQTYEEGFHWNGRAYSRVATTENSRMGRLEASGNLDREWGFLLGGSAKKFDDMRAGPDVGLQRETGYDEYDGDFKLEYFPAPDTHLILAHQRVDQNDAWRAHKTIYGESWEGTTVGDEKKRSFDQDRDLTYLKYIKEKPNSFMDRLQMNLSYHVQEERRDRIRSDDRSDRQGFDVDSLGVTLQMETPAASGHWTYGVEYYRDNVDSFSRKYNADGSLDSIGIQGPVGDDSSYDLLGVYVQDELPLSDRLDLILGTRYTYAAANVDEYEDPVTGNPASLTDRWSSLVSSARLLCHLDEEDHWKLYTGLSQGFRAPNLSDLTRLDTARSNEIETPSPDLDPEKFLSIEAGIKSRHETTSSQCSFFYTDINDMIVRTPTGNVIDGDDEVTKKNGGDGYVYGMELGGDWRFHPRFTAFIGFAWIYGKVDTYPTSTTEKEKDYLDRLMPPTGNLGVRWTEEKSRYWVEGICRLADKADKLSERDKNDTQRIPPGGTPGYMVFTLRSGWQVAKGLRLSAALENLFNEDYRIHGSGQNEPGTNLVVAVNWTF